jgi:uncharacterized protein
MNKSVDPPKRTLRQSSLRVLLLCTALYLLACVGCATFQRRLIYFPPNLTSEQLDRLAQSSGLERWDDASGERLGLKRLASSQPAQGRVLILYGNGSCAAGCGHYAEAIQSIAPLDVFILEYPGYTDRPGIPSQDSLFRAADEALRVMDTNGPIYLVGESLGTGVASYLAGTSPDRIAGVVLLAPYNCLTDVAQAHMRLLPVRWLLVDRFPSQDYLRHYRGPVGMLVAGRDPVVPERFGRRLYAQYNGPKKLWEFPEGDHATVMSQPPETWKEIVEFWQSSPAVPAHK